MAKISDNLSLKRSREPNHSFMNSEDMFLKSSKSASASISEIGPCLYKYDSKCLTTKFQASSINTNNLTYNQERRPFFEDQYAWLTNQYDPSTTQYPIYYGSGTLASNEYPYAGLLSTGLGYAMDISAAILNGNHGRKIDEFQSNMFGNVRRQFKLNTFELSKNLNGAIDWWNTRLNASDSLEDGIFISHRGTGWGRQMFLDPTFYEGYGLNADNGLLSRLFGVPPGATDGIPMSATIPPIPKTYHNILPGGAGGNDAIYNYGGVFNYHTSSHLFIIDGQNAIPIYTKDYEEDGKYHVIQSCRNVEFLQSVSEGDYFSLNPNAAFELATNFDVDASADTKTYSTFKNSLASGDLATNLNSAERGGSYDILAFNKSTISFQKLVMDFLGDGIHRVVNAFYQPFRYYKDQYYNYSSLTGQSVSAMLAAVPDTNMQRFLIGGGFWMDCRFDKVYTYSPLSNQLIDSDNVFVSGIQLSALGNGITINMIYPGGYLDENSYVNYKFEYLSGVNPLGVSSIAQKFFKGSPYYLSSNLLFTIQERTPSCPGGLPSICVAHGYLLNDKVFSDPFTKGYKKGYTLNLVYNQIITSGTPGTANYGRGYELFFNPIFSSTEIINSQWGMNVVGMQGNLAFCEKGWTACEVFVIVGKDKEEVIEKIQYLVNNYNIGEFIDPKAEIPDIIYNYTMPFKVGNVF